MTRRQWWLKNLAVVGIAGAIVWSSTLAFDYRYIFPVLTPCLFFFMLGIGMGWILFPVLSPLGKTRSKYAFVFGLSSLFSASISIVLSYILAYIYSLVFFLTLGTFDSWGIQLAFLLKPENAEFFGKSFFVALTLLASLFAGWSYGRILARLMSWYSPISIPIWFTSMAHAGALAGLSMGAGIILNIASGEFEYTLHLPNLWVRESYSIPISLATALLMASSLSYFTYPYIASKATGDLAEEV